MEIFHKPQCNILSLQQEITVSWFTTTRITFCSKFDIWHTYTINKNIFKLIKHVQCYLQYKLCFPEQFKKTKRKVLGKTYEIQKKTQKISKNPEMSLTNTFWYRILRIAAFFNPVWDNLQIVKEVKKIEVFRECSSF